MSGEPNKVVWRGVRPVDGIRGIWPAINAERVNRRGYQGGVGTDIMYTVPAGKKLFISALTFSARQSAVASTTAYVIVRDENDVVKYYPLYLIFDTAGQQSLTQGFIPALEAEAGWDICISSTDAVVDVRGNFSGWLEDA